MIMVPNPWMLLGAVAVAVALSVGAYNYGFDRGVDRQIVEQQAAVDALNKKIEGQKAEATALYQSKVQELLDTKHALESFKYQLELKHVENQKRTDDYERQLASVSLRYKLSEAELSRIRSSGGSAEGERNPAPGHDEAAIIQLPEEITRNLRQLAKDADQLRDAYELCYSYVVGNSNGQTVPDSSAP